MKCIVPKAVHDMYTGENQPPFTEKENRNKATDVGFRTLSRTVSKHKFLYFIFLLNKAAQKVSKELSLPVSQNKESIASIPTFSLTVQGVSNG
jgi:hypothetical protein